MPAPPKVLVFHTAFIGDIVLALPLVQAVREWAPACHIGFVAIPSVAPMLKDHPAVSEVVVYDKRKRDAGLRGILSMARVLRATHYDLALVPHRSLRSALVVRLAGIPRRIGFDRSAGSFLLTDTVPYIPDMHEVDRNLRLLEPLGIQIPHQVLPVLVTGRTDRDLVEEILSQHRSVHPRFDVENMIALAPGSVWNTKRWPKEHFVELIRLLIEEGYSIVLVGGADDASLCGEIKQDAGDEKVLSVAGSFTLLQSAELIRRCKVAVSNDSAPMHLSVAVRTPVVAIFGATVPQFGFGPLGPQDVVVETLGLSCRPCSIHGGDVCPIRTFVCMKHITPRQVFDKVRSITSCVSVPAGRQASVPEMAEILPVSLDDPEDTHLLSASRVIKAGGVIVYPTETLYGIGCDAFNALAIEKIHSVKNRTDKKPILVIIHAVTAMTGLIGEMPVFAQQLMDAFWPGPLTLVFKAGGNVPKNLSGGSRTIGIRIPSSSLCLRLTELCGCPLTSTSANISGGPVLRSVSEIRNVLTTGIDVYLDAGILPERKPSTVVDVTGTIPRIVREGAISFERIQRVTPNIQR